MTRNAARDIQRITPDALTPRSTIRLRLMVAFLAATLMPMLVIGVILGISNAQGKRQETINQLNTVLSYKESALNNWSAAMKIELGNTLVGENTISHITKILLTTPASPDYQAARESYEIVRQNFVELISGQNSNYNELFIMDMSGVIHLSTNNTQEGQNYRNRSFFMMGMQAPYTDPPSYSPALNRTIIYASQPVFDEQGVLIGVLAGRARIVQLETIMYDQAGLGDTGVTYLVNMNRKLLAGLDPELIGQNINSEGVLAAFEGQDLGASPYDNGQGKRVLGIYRWLPDMQAVLMAEQDYSESARVTSAVMAVNIGFALAALILAIVLAFNVTRSIAAPLSELAENAGQIAAGNLEATPASWVSQEQDEIGILAQVFNTMRRQLGALIAGLEDRVAERTREIELRSNYLEASAQVSQAIASILDPDQLIEQAAELIHQRFELYYVGIFLAETSAEGGAQPAGAPQQSTRWAVLKAATGAGGQALLKRGHRLPIIGMQRSGTASPFADTSMIGWCISNAQARIAQLAESDAVRLATPELPETRSEAAIPLRSRGQVLGAISVQSSRPNAFDETRIAVLQTLADQLATAIDNAHLFRSSQNALEAERRAYDAISQAAWAEWLRNRPSFSVRSDASGIYLSELIWHTEMEQAFRQNRPVLANRPALAATTSPDILGGDGDGKHAASIIAPRLALPIQVRGTSLGVIEVNKPPGAAEWSDDEITLLETITEQIGVALDSARLYSETQKKADQERLIGEISGHMRQSLDVEAVLKTAVEEIYRGLGLENVVIELTPREE